ncbi:MAG TPA: hypothetical protein PLQ36_03145 [Candidatus Gracilibacteria bacterium]|nr:hypothetical protein [Candidatus Gracilibacteria bacterium]
MMKLLTFSILIGANLFLYWFSVFSQKPFFSDWKILLTPILGFPILYALEALYSIGLRLAGKSNISITLAGISFTAFSILIFALGDHFYLGNPWQAKIFIGGGLIILGTVILNWQ